MIIRKVFIRINCFFSKCILKMIYFRKFKFGKKLHFRKGFILNIENTGLVQIGNNVFLNNFCSINSMNKINIGSDCIFGEGVKIYDHNHKFSGDDLIYKQGFSTSSINIGNNCWIGTNVIILKNANIGNNCVIAAGVVIDFDVPDNSIVRRVNSTEIIEIKRRNL